MAKRKWQPQGGRGRFKKKPRAHYQPQDLALQKLLEQPGTIFLAGPTAYFTADPQSCHGFQAAGFGTPSALTARLLGHTLPAPPQQDAEQAKAAAEETAGGEHAEVDQADAEDEQPEGADNQDEDEEQGGDDDDQDDEEPDEQPALEADGQPAGDSASLLAQGSEEPPQQTEAGSPPADGQPAKQPGSLPDAEPKGPPQQDMPHVNSTEQPTEAAEQGSPPANGKQEQPGQAEQGSGKVKRPGLAKKGKVREKVRKVKTVTLQLGLEDVFFLKTLHSVQQLVRSDGQACDTLQELWEYSLAQRPNFHLMYVAYHQLRSQGFIVRSGLQYGVDFVTYSDHMSRVHAEFGVLVMDLQQEPRMVWQELEIVNRLSHQVAKSIRLVYVKDTCPEQGHATPACLSRYQVEQRIMSRWVPTAAIIAANKGRPRSVSPLLDEPDAEPAAIARANSQDMN